jgi:Ser/Thr protein kinase RdoA (MazF antagonist)
MASDPRCHPWIELDRRAVGAMLAPVVSPGAVRAVTRVEGGLFNTLYRVDTADGAAFVLRVYADGRVGFDLERRLLPRLDATLPVPEVLFADDGERIGTPPYLVYRWIDGITLNDCRRRAPHALQTLAEPLGRLLARVAAAIRSLDDAAKADAAARDVRIAERLADTDERLRGDPARRRLGRTSADRLRALLAAGAPSLEALEDPPSLVHGDFGGRNVLVRETESGWEVSGVIDWEAAGAGSALWDVGSLFRYPRRYPPEFRTTFERGYRAAGGELPPGWWWLARLLDATRQVATLSEERELPIVFAECSELVESVVAEGIARRTAPEVELIV